MRTLFTYRSKIQPWVIWSVASLLGLFTFLLQGTPSVMIPDLQAVYQIDTIEIGVLTSSFFYTYILMQVPSGMLVDRWGPRPILLIGFILASLAIAWFALSQFFWEGQIARMIMGIATAPAILCGLYLVSRWFKPYLFVFLVCVTEFIVLFGGVIGEGGVAMSVAALGWRKTMLIIAGTGLFMTVLISFFIYDFSKKKEQQPTKKLSFKNTLNKTKQNFIQIVSIPQVWLSGLYSGLAFGIFPALAALWGVPFISDIYGVDIETSAFAASTLFIGACMGTLTLGSLSFLINNRRFILLIGSTFAFITSIAIIYLRGIPLSAMFGLLFLIGFFSSTYAIPFTIVADYVPNRIKGVAMGFTNMLCLSVGAPILQPLIGFLLEWNGRRRGEIDLANYMPHDYAIALTPLPICIAASFIIALFIKEPKSKQQSGSQ